MDWNRIGTGTLDDLEIKVCPMLDNRPLDMDVKWLKSQFVRGYWKNGAGFGCEHGISGVIFYTREELERNVDAMENLVQAKLESVKDQFRDTLKRGCDVCRKMDRHQNRRRRNQYFGSLREWIPPVVKK